MSAPVGAGSTEEAYRRAVWSWAQHLRRGGTTRWADWTAADRPTSEGPSSDGPMSDREAPDGPARDGAVATGPPPGWDPPGAAQLELVRQLSAGVRARAGRGTRIELTGLADLVLGRSGPGRGLGQQPLSWPAGRAPFAGAPPVDPADVPVEELVRVGVGALTELLLAAASDPEVRLAPGPSRSSRRRRPRVPEVVLDGAPGTVAAVRRCLVAAGIPPVVHPPARVLARGPLLGRGSEPPPVLLLAPPLDRALVQAWSARVLRGAPVRWPGFVRRWAGRDELPPTADLARLAERWDERVGPEAVHVVAAADHADALDLIAGALGLLPSPTYDGRLGLPPAAVDVLRRVNAVLGVRVPEERREQVRRLARATLQQAARAAQAEQAPRGERAPAPVAT